MRAVWMVDEKDLMMAATSVDLMVERRVVMTVACWDSLMVERMAAKKDVR